MPVKYLNFAIHSASIFWLEIVMPSYSRFCKEQNRYNAIQAAWPAWHIIDWLWHEKHPHQDTRNNKEYMDFIKAHIDSCQQLGWLRDITDATKHCGLGRSNLVVKDTAGTGLHTEGQIFSEYGNQPITQRDPLKIILDNGTSHDFPEVLGAAIEYWRKIISFP